MHQNTRNGSKDSKALNALKSKYAALEKANKAASAKLSAGAKDSKALSALQAKYVALEKANKAASAKLSAGSKDSKALSALKAKLAGLEKMHKTAAAKWAKSEAAYKKSLAAKPKTVEVIKEVPVEVIKEVEVVKQIDFASLAKMMKGMKQVEVSKKVVGTTRSKGASKIVERREIKPGSASKVESTKNSSKKVAKNDDLTKIEGVGPAIQKLLNKGGIKSFKDLADAKNATLAKILAGGGAKFQMHDPSTWAQQSKLAANGDWAKLKVLQDNLDGGRR